jgi:hypothetical protein
VEGGPKRELLKNELTNREPKNRVAPGSGALSVADGADAATGNGTGKKQPPNTLEGEHDV